MASLLSSSVGQPLDTLDSLLETVDVYTRTSRRYKCTYRQSSASSLSPFQTTTACLIRFARRWSALSASTARTLISSAQIHPVWLRARAAADGMVFRRIFMITGSDSRR
jgi:hypothetical protein